MPKHSLVFHSNFILSISNIHLNIYMHVFHFTRLIRRSQTFRVSLLFFCFGGIKLKNAKPSIRINKETKTKRELAVISAIEIFLECIQQRE